MRPSPLRQREFATIWSAGLISDTGDWLLIIALPLYVFTTTGSALSTSTLFLAELFPALVLGSFAGVLADRWDPARTMPAVNLLQAAALVPLLAADRQRLWLLFVVAGVEAILETLFTPSKQRLLRRLLAADQLRAGNALIGVSENLARLVGSPLGGLAIALLGLRITVVTDAASYLLSAGLILSSRTGGTAAGQTAATTAFLHEWGAGLLVIRRNRRLRQLVVLSVAGQVAQGMFVVLFVIFIRRTLRGGDAELGLIRGVQAIGAVAGGLVVVRLARLSGRVTIAGGFTAFGLIALATWNAPQLSTAIALYAVLFVLAGVPGTALDAGLTTELQLATPEDSLGRVVAAAQACARSAEAVGLLLAGALAGHVRVVMLLDLQGAVYVGCGLAAFFVLRQESDGAGRQQLSTAVASPRPVSPSGVS